MNVNGVLMFRLLRHMKEYKKECVLGPLFKLFEALIELYIPFVVLNMINIGIENDDRKYIIICIFLLIGMGITGLALSLTAQYFSAKAAVGFSSRVREKLFSHIQSLSYKEIDKIGRSTLINRLTSDLNQVQTGINLALRLLLRSPFIVFGAAIMSFTIDAKVATVFLYTIPVLAIIIFSIMLVTIPLFKRVQARLDTITSKTRENLSGVRMFRALCKEDSELSEFNIKNNELLRDQKFVGKISALMNPLTFVVINIAIAILIYNGALRVEHGLLTQAAVIALYNYMSQILVELIKLANLIINITKAVACGNRVQVLFDVKSSISVDQSSDGNSDFAVEFRNVSFGYSDGAENVLDNINFAVKQGETIGVIGGTGSGKTTLINLMCRFYDPNAGDIYHFGKNLKTMSNEEILKNVGIASQKVELFAGTIKSNVLFGINDASDDDILFALELSQAKEFVDKLPLGLDSPVEQNGRNLSGGQRQRLSIARALIKEPAILILDDTSSALDYITDLKLRKSISSLKYRPTVFIVSQRVSSVKDSDTIIVLDDGNVVGIGRHNDLYNGNGVYKEICDSQINSVEVDL